MRKSIGIILFSLLLSVFSVSAFHMNAGFKHDHGLQFGSQFVTGVYTPIVPLTPYVDPTVRVGGFFGGGNLYLAGLRAGDLQEPYPGMKYAQRLQEASEYYPRYPIDWIRMGGYFGERGVNLKGSPNAPGTFIFGAMKGRGAVFSGFN